MSNNFKERQPKKWVRNHKFTGKVHEEKEKTTKK